MDSVFNKAELQRMKPKSKVQGWTIELEHLLALIEIREAIEEGFTKLDLTSIEVSTMLIGCRETLDGFLEGRLGSDKLLRGLATDLIDCCRVDKIQEIPEQPDEPLDNPEKSTETLDAGGIGQVVSDSGLA